MDRISLHTWVCINCKDYCTEVLAGDKCENQLSCFYRSTDYI